MGTNGNRLVFTLDGTGTVNGKLAYDAGTTVRYFTVNGTLIVEPGGLVYDPVMSAGSVFILNSGATLEIGQSQGITNVTTSATTINTNIAICFGGTNYYSPAANYVYIGTGGQATGTGLPSKVNSLTDNNTGGVLTNTYAGAMTISNSFALATGAKVRLYAGYTDTASNFLVGGVIQASGTWGSTSSTATHTNNTYFDATTGILNVANGAGATKLAYTTVPSTGTAGTAFSVTVQSQDASGNPANLSSATTITLSKASGSGTLSGTLTGVITAGANSVTISTPVYSAADTMTLTATASGGVTLTAVTSGNIVFSAGAASQLVVTTQPSASTVAGVAFATQPVVTIEDQYGNTVTSGADSTVSVALTLTTGTGTLGGTTSMNAVAGVANFSGKGLNINLVGANKVLTATATVTAGTKTTTTSPAFAITFAAASQLVVTTQPSASTVAGVAFATQPVVTIEDQYGNTVTSGADSTRVVTAALTTGSGTLSGTTTATAAAGVANFAGNNLSINLVGADKVLTFTTTGGVITSTTTSPAFAITFAAANAYRITDAASGSPVAGAGDQLTITLVDQFGNTVTSFSSDKTLTFSGLSTADNGTHPTVTDKTGSAVNLGTTEAITFASGVSSSAGGAAVLKAYKAETATLNVLDSDGLSSTSTGGAGVSLTIANVNPSATDLAVTRTVGTRLLIALSNLTNHWSDANSDNVTLASVNTTTAHGATLVTNSSFILCPSNAPNVNDTITYSISDGHGGTGTGHINITIDAFVTGQTSGQINVSGSTATLTFQGIPGYTYITQRSIDSMETWTDIRTNLDNSGPFQVIDDFSDLGSPPSQAFYRLKWQP
jgi:hypothetical protein